MLVRLGIVSAIAPFVPALLGIDDIVIGGLVILSSAVVILAGVTK